MTYMSSGCVQEHEARQAAVAAAAGTVDMDIDSKERAALSKTQQQQVLHT